MFGVGRVGSHVMTYLPMFTSARLAQCLSSHCLYCQVVQNLTIWVIQPPVLDFHQKAGGERKQKGTFRNPCMYCRFQRWFWNNRGSFNHSNTAIHLQTAFQTFHFFQCPLLLSPSSQKVLEFSPLFSFTHKSLLIS